MRWRALVRCMLQIQRSQCASLPRRASFQTFSDSCLAYTAAGVWGVCVGGAADSSTSPSPPSWLPAFVCELLMPLLSPAWLLL